MATEKRLIDATPIIDECKECSAIEWNKSIYTTWAEAEEDFMQRLLDAPTVDAVEVVRCKDCKHNNMNGGYCNRIITMYHYDPILELNVAEYIKLEHCSYGERKDNG